jgi:hypothetical protein
MVRKKKNPSPCTVPNCDSLDWAKGYCQGHYNQWRTWGPPWGKIIGFWKPRGTSKIRDALGRKQCKNCLRWRDEDKFGKAASTYDKLHPICRQCTHYLTHYKLTFWEVQEMLASQDYMCAGNCGKELDEGIRFAIDHDHKCCPGATCCGKCVRAILCTGCNTAVGHIESNPFLIAYVVSHNKRIHKPGGIN